MSQPTSEHDRAMDALSRLGDYADNMRALPNETAAVLMRVVSDYAEALRDKNAELEAENAELKQISEAAWGGEPPHPLHLEWLKANIDWFREIAKSQGMLNMPLAPVADYFERIFDALAVTLLEESPK